MNDKVKKLKASKSTNKFQILKSDIEGINFEKTYNKLKSMLALEVNRADYGKLLELIDSVTENARVAGVLYASAKEAYERFKSEDYAFWWARVSNEATKELEEMKKQKLISGQISEEKIRNWIILNKKESYLKNTRQLNQLKFGVDVMKILYEQWESRKSLLQTQANVIEKRRVVIIGDKN